MWSKFIDILRQPERRRFMQLMLAINIPGSVYGYYWYRLQLAANPVTAWPVIPDSPRSTTFFAVAMMLLLLGRRANWFQAVAYTAVIKYGTWAVVMIVQAWLLGDRQNFIDWMLLVSHAGMAVQGFVFLRHLHIAAAAVTIPALWMIFNDVMDYVFMYHPYLFSIEQTFFAMITAVFLSLALTLLLVRGWRAAKD